MKVLLGPLEQKLGLAGFELTAVVANMMKLAVKFYGGAYKDSLTYTSITSGQCGM